ncbi:MAG: hypothetical protein JSV49_10955 [Thermoplasmata archaeon]|nr:MAG: hypothetical protein JSV49_10955 [Thermoplasmata archaeon]
MTVSSEVFKNIYTCNGATTIFPYTFKIFADDDLEVVLHTIADGTEVTLTLTTDYTVSDAGNPAGGNVTTVATYSSDYQLIIRRNLPYTQETDFVENDPFPADSHEDALDKDVMLIQQLKESLDRAILQTSTATTPLTFPLPSANSIIGWDPTGTFLVNDPPYVPVETPDDAVDKDKDDSDKIDLMTVLYAILGVVITIIVLLLVLIFMLLYRVRQMAGKDEDEEVSEEEDAEAEGGPEEEQEEEEAKEPEGAEVPPMEKTKEVPEEEGEKPPEDEEAEEEGDREEVVGEDGEEDEESKETEADSRISEVEEDDEIKIVIEEYK